MCLDEIMDLVIGNIEKNGLKKQDVVAKFLLEKKIAILLFPKLRMYFQNDSDSISLLYEEQWKQRLNRVHMQEKEIESISVVLKKQGIDFMIVKGLPLSQILVGNPFARECSDIDILVKKQDMVRSFEILASCGYQFLEGVDEHGKSIISDKPDYLYADDYHEFPCIKYHGENRYTIIEIKYATSAISYKYINDFWDQSIEINIGNTTIKTFSIPDTLIHIIAHLYVNSQCEDGYITDQFFRDFVDLKIFLSSYKEIDWNYILDKACEYEMIHQIYFALNSVNILWPNTIANDIINRFSLDKIDYICKCNEDGEIWNWKSDIKTRCFDEKKRLQEYGQIYKDALFCETKQRDIMTSGTYKKVINQGSIEYFSAITYDLNDKKIDILLINDKKLFQEKKIYFFITVVDNDKELELIEYNVSNPDEIKWNRLSGQWYSYDYDGNGIEKISIDSTHFLSDDCDEVCVLIDSYEKIGSIGYRGTGSKETFIISN